MNSRYNPHPPNMRYASPDATRPNPDLVERTMQNFHRFHSPRTQIIKGKKRSWTIKLKPKSPSPKTKIIKGKNRTWTIRNAGKTNALIATKSKHNN